MPRLLHTRFRVSDLDRSIRFYCDNLGFELRGRTDRSPAGNHLAFLRMPGSEHEIELCWSADYDLKVPPDLMHIAIAVKDIIAFCDQLEKKGIAIWPENWRETFPTGRKMAFIDDPDGYEVEILERPDAD